MSLFFLSLFTTADLVKHQNFTLWIWRVPCSWLAPHIISLQDKIDFVMTSEIQAEETSCLTSNESNGGLSPPPSESSNGGRGRARPGRSGSISISSNPTTTSSEEAMHRSVRKSGRYFNPWPTGRLPSFFMFLKFLLCERNNSNVPSRRVCQLLSPSSVISIHQVPHSLLLMLSLLKTCPRGSLPVEADPSIFCPVFQ